EDEDGISLTMPEETWRELLDHLRSGEPFAWHMPGLDIREVTFRPLLQKLISPFGGAYGGPGTFLQYSPDRDPPAEFRTPELRNVGTGYMVLLSELPESLTPEALASFVREAELIVDDALDGVTHNCEEMALEFRFWAGVPVAAIRLAVRPGKLPAGVDD